MAAPLPSEPSPELLELILFALDHGIESVRGGGPLVPFLLTMGGERPTLARFVADSLDRSRDMVAAAASELPADVNLYAFAIDGYLRGELDQHGDSTGGLRSDAIIVEAGQRGTATAFLFAQTYQPKEVTQDLKLLGKPTLVGETANRL
jgi:hypothetical protein